MQKEDRTYYWKKWSIIKKWFWIPKPDARTLPAIMWMWNITQKIHTKDSVHCRTHLTCRLEFTPVDQSACFSKFKETRVLGKTTCKHRGTYDFHLEWDSNQLSKSQAAPGTVAATWKGSAGSGMTNSNNDYSGFVRRSSRPYYQRGVVLMSQPWFSEVATSLFLRLSFPCLSPSLDSPGEEKLNQLLPMSKQLS